MSSIDNGTAGGVAPVSEKTTGNGFLRDVWIILKRWLLKSIRNPFRMLLSLLFPIIFLVLFTAVFGQITGSALSQALGMNVNYITYLIPAIIIQTALVSAASSGVGLVDDMENGMFETMLVSPVNRTAMFLGKALSEIMLLIVQIVIILVLGYVLLWFDTGGPPSTYIETGLAGALGIIAIGIVFAIWFTAFSNIVALVIRDAESTSLTVQLLVFPLLFVSSAFVPVSSLSKWVQVVATGNPITYGVDAVRAVMLGQDVLTVPNVMEFSGIWNTLIPALAVLVVLDIVFGGIAVYYLNNAAGSEVQ